jgi:hypothetical protein
MKVVHNIGVEAFLYPTEDFKKVKKALDLVLPAKAKLKKEEVDSYYGPAIVKLTYTADSADEIKMVLERMIAGLSKEDRREIVNSLDKRLDEDGNLFIRFDKQAAYDGRLALHYNGDVIKTRIKIASYPATMKNLKYNAQILFE